MFVVPSDSSSEVCPERLVTVPALPLTFPVTLPVKSPVTLPVKLPVNVAVIVPALKLPEPSRFTTVFAVFADVAVPPIKLTI